MEGEGEEGEKWKDFKLSATLKTLKMRESK